MNNKSYQKYYWLSWLIVFGGLFVVKILQIPFLCKVKTISVCSMFWICLIIVMAIENNRCREYLRLNYQEKIKEIQIPWKNYCGDEEGFRLRKLMSLKEDFGDENIVFYRKNANRCTLFAFVVFVSIGICMFLKVFLWWI